MSRPLLRHPHPPSPLAQEIDALRRQARMSIRDLARALGWAPTDLGRWVIGAAPDPSPEDVAAMRQALDGGSTLIEEWLERLTGGEGEE